MNEQDRFDGLRKSVEEYKQTAYKLYFAHETIRPFNPKLGKTGTFDRLVGFYLGAYPQYKTEDGETFFITTWGKFPDQEAYDGKNIPSYLIEEVIERAMNAKPKFEEEEGRFIYFGYDKENGATAFYTTDSGKQFSMSKEYFWQLEEGEIAQKKEWLDQHKNKITRMSRPINPETGERGKYAGTVSHPFVDGRVRYITPSGDYFLVPIYEDLLEGLEYTYRVIQKRKNNWK